MEEGRSWDGFGGEQTSPVVMSGPAEELERGSLRPFRVQRTREITTQRIEKIHFFFLIKNRNYSQIDLEVLVLNFNLSPSRTKKGEKD